MRLPDRPAASMVATLVAAALAVVLWSAASAQAHGPRHLRPGVPAAAPTTRALSQALGQATGLSPSQVVAKEICPPVAPGYARCSAQVLVLRSNGAFVRPRHGAHASLGRVRPAARSGSASPATGSSSTPPLADTPAYLQQAYDLAYLSQTAGSNDTVAIIDADYDPTAASDLATYRSNYGLPDCTSANGCFQQVNENGQTSPLPTTQNNDWDQETSLDLDAVSAICPNCKILLVEANKATSTQLDTAMQTAARMGANQISDSWTISASSPPSGTYTFSGVATVAATGDNGYVGTTDDNYPAAFGGVTAAGGTTLAPAGGGPNARGFSESAWSLSNGEGAGSGCDLQVAKPSYQTDTGCSSNGNGRAYADLSADADPSTGLEVYDSAADGWELVGGTSLATPIIASYYAITGATTDSPRWAYTDSGMLNDILSGSNGNCAAQIRYICNAGVGYDGPTGVGSISGAAVDGAPGIGGPPIGSGSNDTYTGSVRSRGATIDGGVYPNGLATTWSIQYGTTTSYGSQTPLANVGSGTAPVSVTGYLSHLVSGTAYHYRLVAQNADGTTYGYDYTFTTAAASPTVPSASFGVSPTTPAPASSVSFDGSGSTDSGASITDYTWDFGDGSTEDTRTSPTADHSYATRGTYNVTLTVTNSDGQSDTTTQTVTVDNPPTAAFTPSATVVAPGGQVSFDGTASTPGAGGSITDYRWNFGDGTTQDTGSTATTSHTFPSPGTFTVKLTITDDLGVTSSATHVVTVEPGAMFTTSASPAPNVPVTFDGSSSTDPDSTITDYTWNFGDGTVTNPDIQDAGSSPTVDHTYSDRGNYSVSLTVTDSNGDTDTYSQTVTVDNPPTAAFTPSATLITPGAQLSFDGSASAPGASTPNSTASITDYSWNFGDGTMPDDTGTADSANHVFAAPGNYIVTLTVTDDLGDTNSVSQTIVVDQPAASFTRSPTIPAPGSTVTFDGSASTDPNGTITDYSWDFGDQVGTITDTGNVPTATHSYGSSGHYTVTLTVTNSHGQSDTSTQTVTVDNPPTAAFTPSATVTKPGAAVDFDGTLSTPGNGSSITDYDWSFGDGATQDTGDTPTAGHTYGSPGVCTVTLTTTDNFGVTNSASHEVTVDAPPAASFAASPNPTTVGSPVGFDASSSSDSVGVITGYSWNFGDGTSATGAYPSHAYASGGTYTVVLTVTNDAGQTDTSTRALTVYGAPTATFTLSPNPVTAGAPVSFSGDTSTEPAGAITGYSWNFGDGTTGSGANPSHVYAQAGDYTATLTVTGSGSQSASTSHTILVTSPPAGSPPPLTGNLTAPKNQKLAPVLKHGLKVNVSVNQGSKVSFQVTIPPGTTKQTRRTSTQHLTPITLLQIRGRAVAAGTHQITLKLSRAAARQIPGSGPVVLTVKITVTGANGPTLTRSVKVTLQR